MFCVLSLKHSFRSTSQKIRVDRWSSNCVPTCSYSYSGCRIDSRDQSNRCLDRQTPLFKRQISDKEASRRKVRARRFQTNRGRAALMADPVPRNPVHSMTRAILTSCLLPARFLLQSGESHPVPRLRLWATIFHETCCPSPYDHQSPQYGNRLSSLVRSDSRESRATPNTYKSSHRG